MAISSNQKQACFRAPQRISITLAHHVVEALVTRSQQEGRSLSNLSAYLLESALQHREQAQERFR
jgi:macrodomain Ter protein organizer (MatP/YcbG family)